jgi:small-conductance mechanosensitive channel
MFFLAEFPIKELLTPEFWHNLFASGKCTTAGTENILLMILSRVLVIALIIISSVIISRVMSKIVKRTLEVAAVKTGHTGRRVKTLHGILSSAISYVVGFIGLVSVLFVFGLTWQNLAPLLGLASVIGLALGFGAQKLVRDIITGLFILGENQFDVGDNVTIGGVTGEVEDIGLRVSRLRDEQGRLYFVANGDISQVFNSSRGRLTLNLEYPVALNDSTSENITKLHVIAREVITEYDNPDECCNEPVVTGGDATKVNVKLTLFIPVANKIIVENAIRRKIAHAVATGDIKLA